MRNGPSSSTVYSPLALKRVEKFLAKYVDSLAKAELLRILAFRPSQFHSLPEILAQTTSSSGDLERAIFSLRGVGLVQLKEGPNGTVIGLSHDSAVRRLAQALWAYLTQAGLGTMSVASDPIAPERPQSPQES